MTIWYELIANLKKGVPKFFKFTQMKSIFIFSTFEYPCRLFLALNKLNWWIKDAFCDELNDMSNWLPTF